MGLLPDTQNCGCACAGNAGNVFPVTAGKRSRHASRHARHARAVMHAGIANKRFPLKSAAGENVPGIPGACATCNFTYLVRGPWVRADSIRYTVMVVSGVWINQGPLLLTWINFDSNEYLLSIKVWNAVTFPFRNVTGKPLKFGNR